MIYNVYAIRDQKSQRFMQPMCDINDQTAQRGFSQAVNTPTGVIGFAPKDFDLYKVAMFDDEKGRYEPLEVIELVCNGAALVYQKESENDAV